MRAHVCVCVCALDCFSHVWLLATPWTIAHQAPLSIGFSRKEYWSGLPYPPPGDLPHPGIEPRSPAWTGRFFTTETPGKPRRMRWGSSKKEQCKCSGQRKQPVQRPCGGQEQVSFKNLQEGSWCQGRQQGFFSKATQMKTSGTRILSKWVTLWVWIICLFFFFYFSYSSLI